jgi:hypothetical protein
MTVLYALELSALGFAIVGLAAVLLEIATKSPGAFIEIATDTAQFAAPARKAALTGPVRARRGATETAREDELRKAA